MRFIKTVILLSMPLLFANEGSFRCKDRADILSGPIPMAYRHLISETYNIPLSQLNPQRGSYLIITPDNMVNHLDELVSFKKSQGFDVFVKTLGEIGATAAEIKDAIAATLMADPMLEYVLLIGDVDGVAAMPSFYYGPENDVTDQKYTHLLGDDFFPDVFIGRFSVDSVSELVVMIRKTINYHRQPLATNPDWLGKALVVAGNYSNTVPIPITPKWTSYWVRDLLLDEGYTSVDTVFYPPTQQGASLIQNYINSGVGIVNYRGWGDANGWHYPEFHVSDVAGLNNGWMTPVFTSFVCNSNDFANNVDPCLGEALTRAGTPSNPKGGVAIVGPSDLHTSTKYNNVINAYMFDAMLDDGIVELGPALNAGLLGLTREFPNLDGPEEVQEFYFHVYNILGDPSVSIYLNEPHEFSVSTNTFYRHDGDITIGVLDLNEEPIVNAVVSIMADDSLLAKGVSDHLGYFHTQVSLFGISTVGIYINKNGYTQYHEEIVTESLDIELMLIGYELQNDVNGNGVLETGETVDVYPIFKNSGHTSLNTSNADISNDMNSHCQVINADIVIPESDNNEVVIPASPFTIRSISKDFDYISLNINTDFADYTLFIPVIKPQIEVNIGPDDLEPNSNFIPELTYHNYSSGLFEHLNCVIDGISDSISFSYIDSSTIFDIESFSSNAIELDDHTGSIDDASIGSDLTLNVLIYQDTVTIYEGDHVINIASQTTEDPISNTWYGYWAYDNTDANYTQMPLFDWVELDPGYNGSGGTEYKLDDDDHVNVELPFEFQYFGRTYDEMTISSNGWVSFELCDIDYFYNYTIPMALGPKAILAPFWDDLEVINEDSIRVYTKNDEENSRFIIEWSRALNGFDEVTEETFAIHLYDQTAMPTESGDGVIEFHYLEIADIDADKNYATVGIEDHTKNEGIQYVFNNEYAPGAAELAHERAIRFTTEAPANYVAPLGTEDEHLPTGFQLMPAYPNPFNAVTTIRYQLPTASDVRMTVYDILGREVNVLLHEQKNAGTYALQWSGTNRFGQPVASGTYFVIMEALNFNQIQKVLLIK